VTHEFQRWLRESAAAGGPALSLVAHDEDIRETVAALTRSHYRMVTTFTEEELASP
jgi:meiotically up-regulated gene 157 (Mug157) protein